MSSVEEGTWTEAHTDRQLFYRIWRPAGARGLLVIVHGFGEHGGRYRHVADALAGQGLAVALPDLWGHGRSGGARGDAPRFMSYVEDLHTLTEDVLLPQSGQTQFAAYGHSLGGLIVIHWALTRPPKLKRLITQSPFLEAGFPVPRWKTAGAQCLARLWPRAALPMDLDADALTRDPVVVSAYRQDPLVHNQISARTYRGILQAGRDALAAAQAIEVPTLVLYGEADRIVSLAAVRHWFEQLRCQKRIVSFPESYHELHHEAAREEVLRVVHEWAVAP